jgi:Leucine-rich repeat (LRR) protein
MGGVKGHLPLEIGNLTELIELNFQESDLSTVPDSIGLCTKLGKLRLVNCKLQGQFPMGVQTLKSLGMY